VFSGRSDKQEVGQNNALHHLGIVRFKDVVSENPGERHFDRELDDCRKRKQKVRQLSKNISIAVNAWTNKEKKKKDEMYLDHLTDLEIKLLVPHRRQVAAFAEVLCAKQTEEKKHQDQNPLPLPHFAFIDIRKDFPSYQSS
jgi:hypothetical protein